ncbi:MAG: M23 family metallopeptidase [Deltaproteobacteria bacterium]|nr:M23 family metallopeptidase [Deltaproteobacteria bacterium]
MSKAKLAVVAVGLVFGFIVGPRVLDRTAPQVTEEIWRTVDPAQPGMTKETAGEAPRYPLRGEPQLELRIDESTTATLEVSGVPQVFTEEEGGRVLRSSLDLGNLSDGQHIVTLTLLDGAWPANRTQFTRAITKDTTPPGVQLGLSSRHTAQGETYAVFARTTEPVEDPWVELDGERIPTVVLDDAVTIRGLTGIGVKTEPGDKRLVVEARDAAGNVGRFEGTARIRETDFPFGGYITLSPKKQTDMLNKSKSKESNDKRSGAYAAKVGLEVPSELFVVPVKGRISSPFGKVRKYNTGVERHHLGTDMAAPSGTPVVSAADGEVVLAELLHIYGNAVIVNHADGVSTSYNHLSAIDVKVGDTVKAGQKVGEVGSTGQSTGPHLHWGMVVDGSAVAAEQWTTRRFDEPPGDDFGE